MNTESENYREEYEDYDDGFSSNTVRNRRPPRRKYEDIYSSSESREIYSNSKSRKKGRAGKVIALILLSLTLIVAVLIGGFVSALKGYVAKVNFKDYDDPAFSASGDDEFDTFSSENLLSDKKIQNILLFGIDCDAYGTSRSDCMMMLTVDKRHKAIKITSFQRDTLIYCPDEDNPEGTYRTKLTNAYAWGSIPLSLNTIEANFGVEVKKYVSVDFEAFKTIVDILGGVEIELTDREILYINCQIASNNQTDYLDAEAGLVRLSSEQALWYARNRGGDIINGVDFTEGTDWDRTERQRKFMEAVFSSLAKAPLNKLMKVVEEVAPQLTTNITEKEMMSLVYSAPWTLRYDMHKMSMPPEDTWHYETNYAGDVIYVDDWQKTREVFKDFIFGE